ncbi:MAG TPA: hypothetical protein VMB79_14525 [Jatrophihabitans sp.]|nr:hypothetical protein [Jatrophihabitans sp.]
MFGRGKRIALLAVAAATVLGTGVTDAAAAAGFTVTAGSATSGSAQFTGKPAGSPSPVFKNLSTGANATCSTSTVSGVMQLGTGLPGANLGKIVGSTYAGCVLNPSASAVTITQSGSVPPWSFNAISETGGVTTAVVSGIVLVVSSSGCSFTLAGNADATYTNSGGQLAYHYAGHALTVSGVTGCSGAWTSGNQVAFETPAPYIVSTPTGPIVII